ncbi:MAG: ABC transporter ATP-binding protein [Chloroflexi bacterium]|nr:ABC transporter ATP-binding protein [Chloroflexota bacterium]MCI0792648.1 ABC transporter ATP-binding protein [Chloroflexota bacterium]MCI0797935.1 ABC transporter ATP-binding protein [Chloroflexota bacterium]MCI0823591.1 ABC transporter ATP-binding protein [Chloroflexota bacterium]MCI0858215.1 ABC transporter ATP-binding protein [Chloroflexota bacterium]
MNLAQSPPSAPEPIISARGLSRVFGTGETSVTAVNQVTLDIHPGSFMAVVGRSGSGKTTLLNLLSGLDRPTGGEVFFQGRDLTTLPEAELVELRRNKIGFVFQSFGLMPLLSALENVELPLHIRGVSWRERRRRALEALETVGLGPRSRHRPYELSGGEQQRVSIARALVTGADAIFADEPTGELDTTTAVSIGEILRDVSRERGATVIVATHDLVLAEITDRIVELVDGQIISEK